MRQSQFVPRSAALVAGLAGLAMSASGAIFTFTGSCNTNWYGVCNTGTPCGGGQFTNINNWGNSSCGPAGGAFPGGADDANIGAFAVTIPSAVTVASISNAPGGVLTWSGGNLNVGTFTNNGRVDVLGGHKLLTGSVTNSGLWAMSGSFDLYWTGATLVNNGTVEHETKQLVQNGGGTITNNGTWNKTGGAGLIQSINFANNGTVDAQTGALSLNSLAIVSGPASVWSVDAGGSLTFNGVNFEGRLAGDVQNAMVINTMTLTDDTVFNVTGNGVTFNSGTLTVSGGNVLTNAAGSIIHVPGGHKFLQGEVVNAGTVNLTGSFDLYQNGVAFTNNGALNFGSKQWISNLGSNSIVNNGTLNKVSGGSSLIQGVPVANNGSVNVNDGTMTFSALAMTGAPTSTFNTLAGQTMVLTGGITFSGRLAGSNAGAMRLDAALTLTGDTTIALSGNAFLWNGGNVVVNAGMTLTNAAGSGVFVAGGHKHLTGTVVNAGNWAMDGSFDLYANSMTFTNTGTIDWGSKQWISNSGSNLLTNNGDIFKTGAGTALLQEITLVNNGDLGVQQGTMNINGSPVTGNVGSTFSTAAASVLNFNSCTVQGRVEGANAGAMVINTMAVPANLTVAVSGNAVSWNSGNIGVAGGATMTTAAGSAMTVAGGHKHMTGLFTNNGTWNLIGAFAIYQNSVTFTNNGLVSWGDKQWISNTGTNSFVNNASVVKSAGSGDFLNLAFANNGLLSVPQGVMTFSGATMTGGASSVVTTGIDGTLNLNSCAVQGRFAGANAGVMAINTVTATANTLFEMTGNPLNWNSGNLTVNAGATFVHGATGRMSVAAGHKHLTGAMENRGEMSLVGSFEVYFNSAGLVNNGVINWVAKGFSQNSGTSVFLNNGLVRVTGNNTVSGVPVTNNGRIDVISGNFALNCPFTQEANGVTNLAGGSISSNTVLTFANGRVTGSGSIAAQVVNSGAFVAPGNSAGAISMNRYTQTGAGTLDIELGGTGLGNFDRVTTGAGGIALNGALAMHVIDGYVPTVGDSFVIMSTTGTRTGTFSSASIDGLVGVVASVTYTANSVVVQITACSPCTPPCSPDFNCDGSTDQDDVACLIDEIAGNPGCGCQDLDFNHDGNSDQGDVEALINVVAGGGCP